jgi:hypothetical protein
MMTALRVVGGLAFGGRVARGSMGGRGLLSSASRSLISATSFEEGRQLPWGGACDGVRGERW